MALDSGSVGAIAAAVAVPIVMAGLARLLPARPPKAEVAALTLDELRARYRSWELGLGLGGLAAAVPIGLAAWLALRGLSAWHARLLGPADVLWVAEPYYWSVPAILLGIAWTLPVTDLVARRLLGARYGEYQAYAEAKTGIDQARLARWLLGGTTALCAAFVLLGLDWSVRADAGGLALDRYLSVGVERHAWAEVRSVRTAPALIAPNGNRVRRREWVVRFADGRTWSTSNLLASPPEAEKRRLIELVVARSGAPVEEVEVLGNGEL